jgi:hypothetical protein
MSLRPLAEDHLAQLNRMRRQIDYHLAHARSAASAASPVARASIAASAESVIRQNSDLQQTLDFPLHPRYSRLDDPRLIYLRFYTRLRI